MYLEYFGLSEKPFSIAPDPTYLYMSERHREAMAHLSYGLSQGGCFIVLTGEVGTGKTTLCRNLLEDLPEDVDVALILNPKINEFELLQTVCDELGVSYDASDSQKRLLDAINQFLLSRYSENRHTVLIIDEAQLLSPAVLEQIRLLTNLETTKDKLLQIILIGQPELNNLLSRNDLRQLAQRVTARYHLGALQIDEIENYVNFRLGVAGCKRPLFSRQALKQLHRLSKGIPRKINVLADQCLLSAYAANQGSVESKTVKLAAKEVFLPSTSNVEQHSREATLRWLPLVALLLLFNAGLWWWFSGSSSEPIETVANTPSSEQMITADAQDDRTEPASNNQTLAAQADAGDSQASSSQTDQAAAELTTIIRSPEIEPGRVVVSDTYLDAEPTADLESTQVTLADSPTQFEEPLEEIARYDVNSEFGRKLESSADLTGRISAFRTLSDVWDASLPVPLIEKPCSQLQEQGVACLDVPNWQSLERFNRPTIMVLRQGDQLHRVILYRLEDQTAKVLLGTEPVELSVSELQNRWNGNAVSFWRPGQLGAELIKVGDAGESVTQVRDRLNAFFQSLQMPELPAPNGERIFDLAMADRVRDLQSMFGLSADSAIGVETNLLLNEGLDIDATPVLKMRIPSVAKLQAAGN